MERDVSKKGSSIRAKTSVKNKKNTISAQLEEKNTSTDSCLRWIYNESNSADITQM